MVKIFAPDLSLALEYQGETHYFSTHIFGKASERQRADQIKRKFAKQLGITLISIPFWWDKSPQSLAATIRSIRPDIHFENVESSNPIPGEIPRTLRDRLKYIPNASKEWNEKMDPTGW
jgi:hypothetical protein